MNKISKKIITMVLAMVLFLGLFPNISYAADAEQKVTVTDKGILDCILLKNTEGEVSPVLAPGVILSAEINFGDGTVETLTVPTFMTAGKEKDGNRNLVGYATENGYEVVVFMTEEEFEKYSKYEYGTYNFNVECYNPSGKMFYSYTKTGRVGDPEYIFGKPSVDAAIFESQLTVSGGGIVAGYFELSKDQKVTIRTGYRNYDELLMYNIGDDGTVIIENSGVYDSSPVQYDMKKGKYLVIAMKADVDSFKLYMGDIAYTVKADSVTIPSTLSLTVGDVNYISDSMTVVPANVTEKATWSSDNTAVAQVAPNGKISAIAPGTAKITVSYAGVSASCVVTVTAKVEPVVAQPTVTETASAPQAVSATPVLEKQTIKFDTKKVKLSKKKTMNLAKCVKVNDKAKLSFVKKSGNKKIVLSKKGKITVKKGLKKGNYKIKVQINAAATSKYDAATLTKTITVKVK